MDEVRAPDKEQIKQEYLKGVKPKELSEKYDISINTIKSWIKRYGWFKLNNKEGAPAKKKGAPFNNKNAVGNKGGGAPIGNKNAEKFGFFSKYLPEETKEIFEAISQADPLDLLWHQIQIAYAAIIRAQQIMYVKDKDDLVKELKREKQSNGDTSSSWEEEYELQFAWERQANFLQAQARAQGELRSMIKQYDELIHKNWDFATEEQKLRMQKLKSEIKVLEESGGSDTKVIIIDDIEGDDNDS